METLTSTSLTGLKSFLEFRNPIIFFQALIVNLFLLGHIFDLEKQNGDHQRAKKHSTTESLYSRHEKDAKKSFDGKSSGHSLEGSWIYALCMRCRVQCEFGKSDSSELSGLDGLLI